MSTENAIATAIRNGEKIGYMVSGNPLGEVCLSALDMCSACKFIQDACEMRDNVPASGLAAIMGLFAKEMESIGGQIDRLNAEICRAVNGEPVWKPKAERTDK